MDTSAFESADDFSHSEAPQEAQADCRVWIVEDHLSISQMLEVLLQTMPGFKLAGACPDGAAAIEAAKRGEVDVVILDLMLPGEGG
jgi:DNA-binding response OmpR family regulator